MKQRILVLAIAALATGLTNGNSPVLAASRSHLTVIHSSGNTGQGVVTANRAKLVRVAPLSVDGGTECSGAVCGATYPVGTRVTLTATAAPGSTFTGWAGDCEGTAPTCVVRMGGHRDVMAHFSK